MWDLPPNRRGGFGTVGVPPPIWNSCTFCARNEFGCTSMYPLYLSCIENSLVSVHFTPYGNPPFWKVRTLRSHSLFRGWIWALSLRPFWGGQSDCWNTDFLVWCLVAQRPLFHHFFDFDPHNFSFLHRQVYSYWFLDMVGLWNLFCSPFHDSDYFGQLVNCKVPARMTKCTNKGTFYPFAPTLTAV